MQIKDSVFIVTGGASGLGAGTVRVLAANGGKVVIADLNKAAGEALVQGLNNEFGKVAQFAETDVASETSAKSAVALALESFGGLHGLVNCAGIAIGEKVLGKEAPHGLASFAKVININLIGTFNMIRLASEAMSKGAPNAAGERGVIVNTASVAAFDGQIGQAAYSASKGGIVGMTLPIARELARFGIRVMTIAPGIFETPMLLGMPPEVQEALGKMVPFPPRLGKPAEYAALVKQIVENEMLNGEVIRLDGAIRMQPK
ncbi:MAG: 3-hydroxyacyl-CoA dehydrogenase [Betaproteobacteria bacterium]|nr:3-hydroxyacyl-CoA dehydrogenase [Betaproteobacteria bacterium]